jgi:hypothetical protein
MEQPAGEVVSMEDGGKEDGGKEEWKKGQRKMA